MDLIKRENVIIIEWVSLPQKYKDIIYDQVNFRNDIFLEYLSEMSPAGADLGEEDWGDTLTQNNIQEYYTDQCETNGYKGSLEDFIVKYGLEFDCWLLENNADLKGIKRILIEVCW